MFHEIKVKKNLNEDNVELEVFKKISRENFFGNMHDMGIDLKHLFKNFKKDIEAHDRFNFFLWKMKTNNNINISESILLLEEEGYKIKTISSLLNDENKTSLRVELTEKFKNRKKISK